MRPTAIDDIDQSTECEVSPADLDSEPTRLTLSAQDAARLDRHDPLRGLRSKFMLPDGVLYFDGNSLGPPTISARRRLTEVFDSQWHSELIGSWERHWCQLPATVATKIAPLIGAKPDEVTVGDSTSVNLFKLLAAALDTRETADRQAASRTVLLCETESFPTNLYIARALCESRRIELKVVPKDRIAKELDSTVAAVCLNHVDYRSGHISDLARLTSQIHAVGALSIWDLSHSVGVMDVDVTVAEVDLAVGCTYKFLNGGPGSPAFLYASRRWHKRLNSPIPGWFGHRSPFQFSSHYEPAHGVERFACGTPSILALAALDGALEVFANLDFSECRRKLARLGDYLIQHIDHSCPEFDLVSPRDANQRGGHVAWRHQSAKALVQRLAIAGVLVDYRPPDIIRFGIAPLYLRFTDIVSAAEIVRRIVAEDLDGI